MRHTLILLSVCTTLITTAFFVVVLAKGEDYYKALMLVPDQAGENIASQRKGLGNDISSCRKGLGLSIDAIVWRIRNRKQTALVNRIMAGSEQVFAASPDTAREMLHLRRMAADRLAEHPQWVLLYPHPGPWVLGPWVFGDLGPARHGDDIFLDPAVANLSTLDAARIFWAGVQHAYDAEGRSRLRTEYLHQNLKSSLSAGPFFESHLRAHRIGCGFLAAGLRLGMKHEANKLGGTDCADGIPEHFRCSISAAEAVTRNSRTLLDVDAIACVELERVAGGNPPSLQGFKPRWSIPECIRHASLITSAPGWRGRDKLCAEAQAKAKAKGLYIITPIADALPRLL